MDFAEEVYQSLLGMAVDEYKLEWVDNAFSPGSVCEQNDAAMLNAYERLCYRLGVPEEDADVEIIINALLDNQRELCLKMFACGRRYERDNKPRP